MDESGQPLAAVEVTLVTLDHPAPPFRMTTKQTTDAAGMTKFESRREWKQEVTFMHGSHSFYWEVCVAQPGRETQRRQLLDAPKQPVLITLSPGVESPCAN